MPRRNNRKAASLASDSGAARRAASSARVGGEEDSGRLAQNLRRRLLGLVESLPDVTQGTGIGHGAIERANDLTLRFDLHRHAPDVRDAQELRQMPGVKSTEKARICDPRWRV